MNLFSREKTIYTNKSIKTVKVAFNLLIAKIINELRKTKMENENKDDLYSWEGTLTAPRRAKARKFLAELAESHQCQIQVMNDDSTRFQDTLGVKFLGKQDNLNALRVDFDLALIAYKLPMSVRTNKYKVDSIVEHKTDVDRKVMLEIKSSKSSKVKELADAIAERLILAFNFHEESNGFLKGKTVKICALGNKDDLIKFKAIFHGIIHDSQVKKDNKSKLRM